MKVAELMEATYSGRRKWRHRDHEHFGLRVEVTKEQRAEIENQLMQLMRRRSPKTSAFDLDTHVGYTSPEHATTFPCEIRLVIHSSDERHDMESLPGQMTQHLLKSAIKKVFRDVLDIPVSAVLDKDYHANGRRYIDMKVGWANEAR